MLLFSAASYMPHSYALATNNVFVSTLLHFTTADKYFRKHVNGHTLTYTVFLRVAFLCVSCHGIYFEYDVIRPTPNSSAHGPQCFTLGIGECL